MNIIDRLLQLKSHYTNSAQNERADGLQYAIDEIKHDGVEVYTVEHNDRMVMFLSYEAAAAEFERLVPQYYRLSNNHPARYDLETATHNHVKLVRTKDDSTRAELRIFTTTVNG